MAAVKSTILTQRNQINKLHCILYRQCIAWDLYAPRTGDVSVHVSDHCVHEHTTQELFCSVGI